MKTLHSALVLLAIAGLSLSVAADAADGPRGQGDRGRQSNRGNHSQAQQQRSHRNEQRAPRAEQRHSSRWAPSPNNRHVERGHRQSGYGRSENHNGRYYQRQKNDRHYYGHDNRRAYRPAPYYYVPRYRRPPPYYYAPAYRPWPGAYYGYYPSACYGGAAVQIWVDGFGFSYSEPCY